VSANSQRQVADPGSAGGAQAFEDLERYAARPATPTDRNVAPNQAGT